MKYDKITQNKRNTDKKKACGLRGSLSKNTMAHITKPANRYLFWQTVNSSKELLRQFTY